MIVTNISGPTVSLYLLGARLLSVFPMVPLYGNDALGIAILSYGSKLYWGLNAHADRVSDLSGFCEDIHQAFEEIQSGIVSGPTQPTGPL